MEKNYFNSICEIVCNNEKIKKFKTEKTDVNSLKISTNEKTSYEITYNEEAKKIYLKLISAESNKEKTVSSWLLDSQTATQKDMELIAKDFISSIVGTDKTIAKQAKKKSSAVNNSSGLFFANRIATFFPELKEKIQEEKDSYEEFRSATFAKSQILPIIDNYIKIENNKSKLNKLGKTLSELYKSSDLDIRSIITMVILNGLSEENLKFSEFLSDELKTAWEHAKKYKGKKVKPEKKKKQSLISKALQAQQ